MSAATHSALDTLTLLDVEYIDNQSAPATNGLLTGQSMGLPGQSVRFVNCPPGGTACLPSVRKGDICKPIFVANDGAFTLTLFPYADPIGNAEQLNYTAAVFGTATAGLAIAAGSWASFLPLYWRRDRGGAQPPLINGWSASVAS